MDVSRNDMLGELANADVYLTMTQSDGLANITLDGLSLGLPAFLTDQDGWAHEQRGAAIVWEGWATNASASAYPQALAQIGAELCQLSANPDRYMRMSQAAMTTAARFDYPRFQAAWQAVLQEAI